MFKLFCIVMTLGLSNCERKKEAKPSEANKLDELRQKKENYLVWSKDVLDKKGWILTDKCDALLHTSLYKFSGGESDIGLAQDEDGRFWRRPARDCLSSGESKSTISRDMILGAMFVVWQSKNLESISTLLGYLENTGSLGEHDGSLDGKGRVEATPTFKALMYEVRHNLGGPYSKYQEIPQVYFPQSGYRAHLQALNILLFGMMNGEISKIQRNTIASYAEDDSNNALFQAIFHKFEDCNQQKAVDILLRNDLFPADRLPQSVDRCEAYLWMHGENKNWKPCNDGETYPGHDFLFAASVILDDTAGKELRLVGD